MSLSSTPLLDSTFDNPWQHLYKSVPATPSVAAPSPSLPEGVEALLKPVEGNDTLVARMLSPLHVHSTLEGSQHAKDNEPGLPITQPPSPPIVEIKPGCREEYWEQMITIPLTLKLRDIKHGGPAALPKCLRPQQYGSLPASPTMLELFPPTPASSADRQQALTTLDPKFYSPVMDIFKSTTTSEIDTTSRPPMHAPETDNRKRKRLDEETDESPTAHDQPKDKRQNVEQHHDLDAGAAAQKRRVAQPRRKGHDLLASPASAPGTMNLANAQAQLQAKWAAQAEKEGQVRARVYRYMAARGMSQRSPEYGIVR